MKRFRELTVIGPPEALESLVETIEAQLRDGWHRNREREDQIQRLFVSWVFWFECRSNAERPAVALMMSLDGRRLSVADIFPRDIGELTVRQYNSILVEFYLRFLQEAAFERNLLVELSSDERDPTYQGAE